MTIIDIAESERNKRRLKFLIIGFIVLLALVITFSDRTPSKGVSVSDKGASTKAENLTHDSLSAARQSAPETESHFIPAGTVICVDPKDAFQYSYAHRLMDNFPMPISCSYVGADIDVNLLRTQQMGDYTIFLVGNLGGAFWVSDDELKSR
jgi:hypothetical protein